MENRMSSKMILRLVVRQALVAGLYVALTLLNFNFSYGNIQFRIAEILVFLCFFRKDYVIGLTLGCFIANLFSLMLLYDITFGVLASFISCMLIAYSKNIFVSMIYPVVFNGLLVGLELYLALDLPFALSMLEVAAGELAVMVVGAVIFFFLQKELKHDYLFLFYLPNFLVLYSQMFYLNLLHLNLK